MTLMDEDDSIDEISQIEARIEELAEVSERCRKIILVSKAAIAGGFVLLLVVMLGLFGSSQVARPRIDRRGAGRNCFAGIECQYACNRRRPP